MMTPEQGLTAYLQLEGPRTLEGLRQKLIDDDIDPPSLHWFQKWSAKDKWRDRAKEHDRQVELRTSEKIVEAVATKRAEFGVAIEEAGTAACERLAEKAKTIDDADDLIKMLAALSEAYGIIKTTGKVSEPLALVGPYQANQITAGIDTETVLQVIDDMFEEMEALPPPEGA